MRKILFILFAVLLFNLFALAQSNSPEKIEEFGRVSSEDLEARLDGMVNAARQNPTKAIKATIYRGINKPIGFTHRLGGVILAYADRYKIEKGRFTYEDCGVEETQHISFYLISESNTKSLCTKNEKTDFSESFLFDSFNDSLWKPDNCPSCCVVDCFDKETSLSSLNAFSELIKQYPESQAYIKISWSARSSKYRKTKAKYLREIKNVFIEKEISESRIIVASNERKVMDFDTVRNVELWVIAPDGFIPNKK